MISIHIFSLSLHFTSPKLLSYDNSHKRAITVHSCFWLKVEKICIMIPISLEKKIHVEEVH